jgi:uracil permease
MGKSLLLDIQERPKNILKWLAFSLQHVFAMFGATVLVPILTGLDIGVALVASGVGTLIYILLTKAKVPVYLGSSFAYIAAIIIAVLSSVSISTGINITEINQVKELIASGEISYGEAYGSAYLGLMFVAIIYIIVSFVIRRFGKTWLDRLLPPVVIGPMIAIIGISLAGVATGQAGLVPDSSDSFFVFLATNALNPIIALVSFGTTVGLAIFAKGFFKVVPILGGIVVGYVFALLLSLIGLYTIDFSAVAGSSFFAVPNFIFLGTYSFNWAAVLMFAPIAFVTIAEHIGDHKVLGSITNKDFLKDPGLENTLLGDGIATFVSAAIGGPANTTYGENTGVVGMTKVASVWVVALAAVLSIGLGFLGTFTEIIRTIPAPVMGGVLVLLFGLIAGNGLKVMVDARVNLSSIRNIIIVATMLVIGLGGAKILLNDASQLTGMALAVIFGVILNLVLPEDLETKPEQEPKNDKFFAREPIVHQVLESEPKVEVIEVSEEVKVQEVLETKE